MQGAISSDQITALILAGGRGARMGGADKGLQTFRGQPLTRAVLERLTTQTLPPTRIAISANRNLTRYAVLGQDRDAPVWPDDADITPYAGPLAALLTGLRRAATPYLLIVPCDAPWLPTTLCERLAQALQADPRAALAVARAPDGESGGARLQPTFCLLRRHAEGQQDGQLARDLADTLAAGERKVSAWIARQPHVIADFDTPGDDPRAFANANTREQLRALETS